MWSFRYTRVCLKGLVGAEAGADAQGVKDPSNGLRQVLDVQVGHNCIGRVLCLLSNDNGLICLEVL